MEAQTTFEDEIEIVSVAIERNFDGFSINNKESSIIVDDIGVLDLSGLKFYLYDDLK